MWSFSHTCVWPLVHGIRHIVLHFVGCTEVDRRNKNLKWDITFVEDLYGNQLAKFRKGNQTFTYP